MFDRFAEYEAPEPPEPTRTVWTRIEPPETEPPTKFRLRNFVDTPGKKLAVLVLALLVASLLFTYVLAMYGPAIEIEGAR